MTWYDRNFKRRMPLVIDTSTTGKGSCDFTFVPPSDWDDFWDNVRSDGFDVVITDRSGTAFTFERLFGFSVTTRTGLFRVAGFNVVENNVMHMIYVYWDNPDQSTDLSSTVATTSPKTVYAYLAAPFKYIVTPNNTRGLSTTPATIIQKNPDEQIDIWFPISQLLTPRALPHNERLDFTDVEYIDANVLNSSGVDQTTMYALEETRIINGWIKLRIKEGSANTDYVVNAIIFTSNNEKFILSCLLQVRQLLPT